MSSSLVELAVAQVLDAQPGSFRDVAGHPTTVVALRRVHDEIRLVGPDAAVRLASSSTRAQEVVRISRAVTARLEGTWYDEADLFTEATRLVRAGGVAYRGHVVVHLPVDLSGLALEFVEALAERIDVHLLEHDPHPARSVPASTRFGRPSATSRSSRRPTPTTRCATRCAPCWRPPVVVCRSSGSGSSGRRSNRMPDWSSTIWTPPASSGTGVPARCSPSGWSPASCSTCSTSTGVACAGKACSPCSPTCRHATRRERCTRRPHGNARAVRPGWPATTTGVSGSAHSWGATAGVPPPTRCSPSSPNSVPRSATRDEPRRWSEWADWCVEQTERWVGSTRLERLPEAEYRAYEALTSALDRLRHLDPVGEPVTRHRFRSALESELDAMPGRVGRVGDGVTVAALAGAVGLDIDVAIVLGAAEGTLPPRPTSDPLLTDAERADAGLPTSDAHTLRMHRALVALEDTSDLTFTVPRGDLRSTAHVEPSRWLDHWTSHAHTLTVPSHTAGLAVTVFPVSPSEHRLRARSTHVRAGGDLATAADVAGDRVLSRAITMTAARRSDGITVFDGDLSSATVPRIHGVISPSQLEAWAACPHAYFVHYLLHVTPIEEPADQISITASDIGTTQHRALDQFHRAVIAGELPQPTEHGWTDEHLEALMSMFDDECARAQRRGRTGRSAYWSDERERMRADLTNWLRHDSVESMQTRHHRGGVRAPVRCRFARRQAGRAGPRRRPDDRPARHGRPHRPDGRWHDRRHRSQVRRGEEVQGPDRRRPHARRHSVPTAGLCRRGRHIRRRPRVARPRRIQPDGQGRLQAVRLHRHAARRRSRRPRSATRRRRHRNGVLPTRARAAGMAALHALPLLRPRRTRHGRTVGRLAPQAARRRGSLAGSAIR